MLIYDDSFTDVMTATESVATELGARTYGSEHLLLGLLAAGGPLSESVTGPASPLTYETVHDAVVRALDDAPLLESLGLSHVATQVADVPRPRRRPRHRHTPELQAALNSASATWGRLGGPATSPGEPGSTARSSGSP